MPPPPATATSTAQPPSLHYARDSAMLEVYANAGAAPAARGFLNVGGSLSQGDTLTFTFAGRDVVLTAAASPDDSGLQIPTQSTPGLPAYIAQLVEGFRQNLLIASAFEFTFGTAGIDITAKSATISDLAITSSSSAIAATVNYNPDPDAAPAAVILDVAINRDHEFAPPLSLGYRSAPLDADRVVLFDVSQSIDLAAAPPPPSAVTQPSVYEVPGISLRYTLRIGVRENSPAVTHAMRLVPSSHLTKDYIAVHGRSNPIDYSPIRDIAFDAPLLCLHNAFADAPTELLTFSPAFRYFVAIDDVPASDFSIEITPKLKSGVVIQSFNAPLGNFTLRRGATYTVPVGFSQLGIDTTRDAAEVISYQARLVWGTSGMTLGTFEVLRECPDYLAHLVVDNQMGGCETLRLDGAQKWATPIEANPVLVPAPAYGEAQFHEGNRRGQHIVECSTGYVHAHRARTWAAALPARAWLLNRGKFLPAWVEKTSDVYLDTTTSLYQLPLRVTLAEPLI